MIRRASLIVGIVILLTALGIFAWVTDAPAYLGHEAATCNNCHVMDAQYENWYHAAHARYAVCTDCHLPHQNVVSYCLYKAYSGIKDVFSFTFKTYPVAVILDAVLKEMGRQFIGCRPISNFILFIGGNLLIQDSRQRSGSQDLGAAAARLGLFHVTCPKVQAGVISGSRIGGYNSRNHDENPGNEHAQPDAGDKSEGRCVSNRYNAKPDAEAQANTKSPKQEADQPVDGSHPNRADAHQQQVILDDAAGTLEGVWQADIFDDHGRQDQEGSFSPNRINQAGQHIPATRPAFASDAALEQVDRRRSRSQAHQVKEVALDNRPSFRHDTVALGQIIVD